MKIDLTIIPAKVVITNTNVAPTTVTEENEKEGVVVVPFFQTNLTQVLKAGDSMELIANTSEALSFYLQLADSLENVTVKATKVGA